VNLIQSLEDIPIGWTLTPVSRNKAPVLKKWQSLNLTRPELIQHLQQDNHKGYGIVLGEQSGGIIAIDCDGRHPHQKLKDILGTEIPTTVSFTSGKPDRAQYLFSIPSKYWHQVKSKKIQIKLVDRVECLEFRWNGNQSVLPPSVHPETGYYRWINSPTVKVAQFPQKALSYLIELVTPTIAIPEPKTNYKTVFTQYDYHSPIPIELCLAKRHRDAIANGAMQGSRNDVAVSLAKDLVGTVSKLKSLGEIFDGDPRSLFIDFCDRCSPSIPQRKRDEIWNWVKEPVNPSINDDAAFQNCINAWKRKQQKLVTNNT
jgi:Bifunctional DNA primase/polymerase, N-terminal